MFLVPDFVDRILSPIYAPLVCYWILMPGSVRCSLPPVWLMLLDYKFWHLVSLGVKGSIVGDSVDKAMVRYVLCRGWCYESPLGGKRNE